MDWSGRYVVAWEDDSNTNDIYQIYAAYFDADGNKIVDDFTVAALRDHRPHTRTSLGANAGSPTGEQDWDDSASADCIDGEFQATFLAVVC